MINSLIGQLIQNDTLSISFTSQSDPPSPIVNQIIRALPEVKLKNKKWKEFTIDIDVQLNNGTNNTVVFDMDKGIIIGNNNTLNVSLYVNVLENIPSGNPDLTNIVAFSFYPQIILDFTM